MSAQDFLHRMPDDLRDALGSDATLREKWDSLTPFAQNEWICWTISCKQQATREKHLVRLKEDLLQGKRRPCCWAGCIHRRDSKLLVRNKKIKNRSSKQ